MNKINKETSAMRLCMTWLQNTCYFKVHTHGLSYCTADLIPSARGTGTSPPQLSYTRSTHLTRRAFTFPLKRVTLALYKLSGMP